MVKENKKYPLKVMYLIDKYVDPYAGTEKQLQYLLKNMNRLVIEPSLTLFRSSSYIETHVFPCKVNILGISKLLSAMAVLKIISFGIKIKRDGYSIVHIFFNDPSILSPIFLKLCGLKVIISRRDMGFWYTETTLAILRINRYFIDAAITNCKAVSQITYEKEFVPKDKIHVIYNGVEFPPLESENERSKINSMGFPHSKEIKVVGIVANLRPVKRIGDLIKAFAIVSRRIRNTRLVIVGAGDTNVYSDLAKKLNIDDLIHFTGKRKDVSCILKRFDVAVLCSETEGLSNALLEYMTSHVPVVCTDTGGNKELIIDEETGYLVPVGDIDLLAEKICSLLSNENKAKNYADQAKNFVTDLCDMNNMITHYEKLYSSI